MHRCKSDTKMPKSPFMVKGLTHGVNVWALGKFQFSDYCRDIGNIQIVRQHYLELVVFGNAYTSAFLTNHYYTSETRFFIAVPEFVSRYLFLNLQNLNKEIKQLFNN